jgi:hypothetical protein
MKIVLSGSVNETGTPLGKKDFEIELDSLETTTGGEDLIIKRKDGSYRVMTVADLSDLRLRVEK